MAKLKVPKSDNDPYSFILLMISFGEVNEHSLIYKMQDSKFNLSQDEVKKILNDLTKAHYICKNRKGELCITSERKNPWRNVSMGLGGKKDPWYIRIFTR